MVMTLSDETRADFAATYEQLKGAQFGSGPLSDATELSFVEELIRGAEAGDVAHHGALHHITPAEISYLDEATLLAQVPRRGLSRPQAALLRALVAAFIGYVLLTLLGGPGGPPVAVTPTITPTVVVAGGVLAPTFTPTTVPPTAVAGFPATVNGERLPEVRPNTLELGGRSFLAYVAPVKDSNWAVSLDPGRANWVPGATIHWSFALYLDSDPTAPAWVAGLTPPLTATVRVSDGRARLFRLAERQIIRRTQTEVFDPHWAGLTLVLKTEGGDERTLLRGPEIAASESGPSEEGGEVSPSLP
jgi:hypothetical protein